MYNSSTILVYLEIEFSKLRELQQKSSNDKAAHEALLNERYLTKLAFKLHELDANLERYRLTDHAELDERLQKEAEFFELRSKQRLLSTPVVSCLSRPR